MPWWWETVTFGGGIGASWLWGIGPGTLEVGGIWVAAGGAACIGECCCGGGTGKAATSNGFTSGTARGSTWHGCGRAALTGTGASAFALSFAATGVEVSFKMTVLLAISCKCWGWEAVESFDLFSSESVVALIGGSMSIGWNGKPTRKF